jgi:hypothetical protein
MTYLETFKIQNRKSKSYEELAWIDKPCHQGWTIRFAHNKDKTKIAYEFFDEDGNCVMWHEIDFREANNCPAFGGYWDINIPLVGRYVLKPSTYSWDVKIVHSIEIDIESRNSRKPIER